MEMDQCKRCGREATHYTIDGGDSDVCCAEYPRCKGDVARDPLGRMVREVWIEWARQQPVAKEHWLKPYDQLDEPDKEVDRRIGERLYAQGLGALRLVLDEVGMAIANAEQTFGQDSTEAKGVREALRAVAKVRDRLLADAKTD
jgi:hypothetical protein